MFLVMCRVVIAPGRTHICSQRKYGSFFFVQPGSGAQPYGPAACVRRLPRSASCLSFGVRVAR